MVNPTNAAGFQQSSVVNPFQQRPDQNDNNTQKTGQSFNVQQSGNNNNQTNKSNNTQVANAGDQGSKPKSGGSNRGNLVDITV